ncbi:hypothetical protein J1N35_020795 [Gossypium stocksii]|uniref:Uncharacterized protein n=1 Tax=Gossypium stocksii TaxID=47602 RepID=A0A9D3VFI8_9ROSI|nr:hypothetical protein J1N35_020795 [Gossypium stocksii]
MLYINILSLSHLKVGLPNISFIYIFEGIRIKISLRENPIFVDLMALSEIYLLLQEVTSLFILLTTLARLLNHAISTLPRPSNPNLVSTNTNPSYSVFLPAEGETLMNEQYSPCWWPQSLFPHLS